MTNIITSFKEKSNESYSEHDNGCKIETYSKQSEYKFDCKYINIELRCVKCDNRDPLKKYDKSVHVKKRQ
jgi:hypothetical protein